MARIESAKSPSSPTLSPRERLLRKINDESDLPTLGAAIAKVVEITSSGEDSVSKLAHFILADVGLTQKILRLSNTVQYRTTSGAAVTTISRSIFLLGFDTVKTSAMAMLLVDFFKDKAQAVSVRKELVRSLCASIIGREMSQRGRFPDGEEAAVAALFKNIGRVLVASFDHQLYSQIQKVSEGAESTSDEASLLLLGCSFERFGEMALQEWKIPDAIVQSMGPLANGEQKKVTHRNDWLKQVASFSDSLADLVMSGKHKSPGYANVLLKKFGKALEIDLKTMDDMLVRVEAETLQLAKSMNISLAMDNPESDELHHASALPSEFLMKSEELVSAQESDRYPSGKPLNARDLLLAGVQDVTQMLASEDLRLSDLILLVLETLYTSMGFRFATVCLRDLASGRYVSRVAVGEKYADRQKGFGFPAKAEADLFHLSMSNNVDVMISDATVPKILTLLPLWHRELLPDARSFIILPLVIQKKPLGLFYADRTVTAEEGVPADETALIKTLKSQLLAAMMRGG
ncbi:HDOD domain-containing protein [Undibacterium sp. Dicai25W]|uniref:HDOD domain-containing protein n=1 Tax=Undibacterium sp. Dicai25W TaxID=3413034 RepID=UPI003BF230E0